MTSLSDLANSIPVVGVVKGIVHYACGEVEEGNEAMYQSSRTTAVIAGGVLGGPLGAVGAAVATDTAASALMAEEKGVVSSCKNIVEDISINRDPMGSIAYASLHLTSEAL